MTEQEYLIAWCTMQRLVDDAVDKWLQNLKAAH